MAAVVIGGGVMSSPSRLCGSSSSKQKQKRHSRVCLVRRRCAASTSSENERGKTNNNTSSSSAPPTLSVEEAVRASCAESSAEAAVQILSARGGIAEVSASVAKHVIRESVSRGNVVLVRDVLNVMRRRRAGRTGGVAASFPPVDTAMQCLAVRGLSEQLLVSDAIALLEDVRTGGIPRGGEVPFGDVVRCPLDDEPLAAVQPQQSAQICSCASCGYAYRIVTGEVTKVESEALTEGRGEGGAGIALEVIRRVSGEGGGKGPPLVRHSFVVTGSDGLDRAFEGATSTDEVPGRRGDRVSVVCAVPDSVVGRVLAARPPGRIANEPMSVQNHTTGRSFPLTRPPTQLEKLTSLFFSSSLLLVPTLGVLGRLVTDGGTNGELGRVLEVAAEGLAGAAAVTATSSYLIAPSLRQQDTTSSAMELVRAKQVLLSQYAELQGRIRLLLVGGREDIQSIARLYQLENKMNAVAGGGANGEEAPSYAARMQRVQRVRAGVEGNLDAKVDLIDRYGRISAMIEIEVEMSEGLAAAEVVTFAAEMAEEVDRLQEDQEKVTAQSAAAEEVERIFSEPVMED